MTHIIARDPVVIDPVTIPAEYDHPRPGSVTRLSDGSYVVLREVNSALFIQHFSAQGTALAAAFRAGDQGNIGQHGGVVTALDNGAYAVTWIADYDGEISGAFARVFKADDTPAAALFRVNATVHGNQSAGPFLKLADGNYVVLINSDQESPNWPDYHSDLFLQRFDASWNRVGGEERVNTTTNGTIGGHLVALDGGGFVAAWIRVVSNTADAAFFQRYDANLVKIGGEVRIDDDRRGGYNTVVAMNGGGFALIWAETVFEIGTVANQLKMRAVGADGVLGTVTTLSSADGNQQTFSPVATRLSDGDIVVVWAMADGGIGVPTQGNDVHIYFQRLSGDGQRVGPAQRVDTTPVETVGPDFFRWGANVAALDDGGFIVSWTDDNGDHSINMLRQYSTGGATGPDGRTHHYFGSAAVALAGEAGNDVYHLAGVQHVITGDAGGLDTVIADFSYTLAPDVEILELIGAAAVNGTGNQLNNTISGNAAVNSLYGLDGDDSLVAGDGNDRLFGGNGLDSLAGGKGNDTLDGGAGADTLTGGSGNDTFIVDMTGDVIIEATDEGIDLALAGSDYVLGAHADNLTLTGSALSGTGNAQDNVIRGNDGNNRLDGGLGYDTLIGGRGDDTYVIDHFGTTQVIERANEGTDTLLSRVSDPGMSDGIEIMILAGTDNINATGNAAANTLIGNSGNNQFDGAGGADTLIGGSGDDSYLTDAFEDTIVELAGGGIDTLIGSAAIVSLDGIAFVENIWSQYGGLTFIGNALANRIMVAGFGNDLIDGQGGADIMEGGDGFDTYVVDDAGDVIVDSNSASLVQAAISYTLGATADYLTLIGAADLNGSGNDHNNMITGNSGNNRLDGGAGRDMLYGGAGDDTYVVDQATELTVEQANEGLDWVLSDISLVLGSNVENLTLNGTANLDGAGNALANRLEGNSGANVLDGMAGADTLAGRGGDDTYFVDDAGDTVTELNGGGSDTVQARANHTLSAYVESLVLTGAGNLTATGNSLVNSLTGNASNNLLDGRQGGDTMAGGAGNDTYVVDNNGDAVTELASGGNDLVQSSVRYTLGEHIERLSLTGTANIAGTGNGLDNILAGNTGNNRLDGGAGADTMVGGAGDDVYIIDGAGDTAREMAGDGNDSVVAGFSYSLGTQYIENLTLTGTDDLTATGNALANTLIGNAGNNLLNGGSGADNMWGGAGNDSYYVDNVTDRTYEKTTASTDAGGHDIVYASVRVVLDQYVEDLVITGAAGLAGTGNGLDNSITGNSGNNVLSGKDGNDVIDGGAGADVMAGGFGNDTYFVDNVADRVVEANGQGYDTVYSSVSFSFGNQYFDTLTLTGTGDIDATGNAVANWLSGNDGANILNGGGGNDTVEGRGGSDVFVFGLKSGVDMITDFSAADGDTLDLHAWAHGVVGGGGIVITEAGSDTIVTLGGGNSVTVANATAGDVTTHIVW